MHVLLLDTKISQISHAKCKGNEVFLEILLKRIWPRIIPNLEDDCRKHLKSYKVTCYIQCNVCYDSLLREKLTVDDGCRKVIAGHLVSYK